MNVKQFEYILALAELKNFGQAAQKCFISQSTLSTMVQRFEKEINIQIFDRKTKPVSITKEGKAIIEQLKSIQLEIGHLKELVQSVKGELSGEIKIGIIPTIAPFILPEFLNDFTKSFPEINFSVSEMTTERITHLLQKRELDIGIMAIPLDEESLVEVELYNEPFVLYDCSGSKIEEFAALDKLDYENFWLLADGHCLRTQVQKICELSRFNTKKGINFDFKTGSIESLIRFVKINKGITILPYLASLDFSRREQKKITFFKSPIPVRTIGLVVHEHFVKKRILNMLKVKINEKILPLLDSNKEELVVSPI